MVQNIIITFIKMISIPFKDHLKKPQSTSTIAPTTRMNENSSSILAGIGYVHTNVVGSPCPRCITTDQLLLIALVIVVVVAAALALTVILLVIRIRKKRLDTRIPQRSQEHLTTRKNWPSRAEKNIAPQIQQTARQKKSILVTEDESSDGEKYEKKLKRSPTYQVPQSFFFLPSIQDGARTSSFTPGETNQIPNHQCMSKSVCQPLSTGQRSNRQSTIITEEQEQRASSLASQFLKTWLGAVNPEQHACN